MTGYTPEQMPVLSTLARGFATFDHWFCEVPSQTFTNRSFFHAATASGFVVNAPYANFPVHNTAETLFERLEANGPDLAGVLRPAERGSVHRHDPRRPAARPLRDQLPHHRPLLRGRRQRHAADLLVHRAEPVARPQRHAPADHGAVARVWPSTRPPSLLGGEALLARIYDAIRSSSSPTGSNCSQHPAHGRLRRARRHLRPRPAAGRAPARPGRRRPGRWVSLRPARRAHCPRSRSRPGSPSAPSSTTCYRHTSVIRTLRERWDLGEPFTARDADARRHRPVLSSTSRERPRTGPTSYPQPVPEFDAACAARRAALAARRGALPRLPRADT